MGTLILAFLTSLKVRGGFSFFFFCLCMLYYTHSYFVSCLPWKPVFSSSRAKIDDPTRKSGVKHYKTDRDIKCPDPVLRMCRVYACSPPPPCPFREVFHTVWTRFFFLFKYTRDTYALISYAYYSRHKIIIFLRYLENKSLLYCVNVKIKLLTIPLAEYNSVVLHNIYQLSTSVYTYVQCTNDPVSSYKHLYISAYLQYKFMRVRIHFSSGVWL